MPQYTHVGYMYVCMQLDGEGGRGEGGRKGGRRGGGEGGGREGRTEGRIEGGRQREGGKPIRTFVLAPVIRR